MNERSFRRLVFWNRFWLSLLILAALGWATWRLFEHVNGLTREPHVRWDGGDLRISTVSDSPFVVTHLVRYPRSDSGKAAARLPEPLLVFDSGGGRIEAEAYRKLVWRNLLGQTVPAPPEGSEVRVLFYRLQTSEPAIPDRPPVGG